VQPRRGNHAVRLLARYQRPHSVMHQHDFRDFTNLRQRIAHGFLARAAAAYYSHRTAKALARDSRRERFRFLGQRSDQKIPKFRRRLPAAAG